MTTEELRRQTEKEIDHAITESRFWQVEAEYFTKNNRPENVIEDRLARAENALAKARSLIEYLRCL